MISLLKKVNKVYLYIIIIILFTIAAIMTMLFVTDKEVITNTTPLLEVEIKEETIEETKQIYKVDIKGNVTNPGVYSLEEDSRVIDAINLAGGILENSDTSLINLSQKIKDEMTIIVYTKEEIENYKVNNKEIEYVYIEIEKCPDTINDACINKSEPEIEVKEESSLISINTATIDELDSLPSIGKSKAESIVNYREENGQFEAIEDIKNVSGIGDSLFETIKDLITI